MRGVNRSRALANPLRILVVTSDYPSELNHVAGVFIHKQVLAIRRRGHDISVLRVVPFAPPLGEKWRKYRALQGSYSYEGISVDVARTVILPRLLNFPHL